MRLSGKTRSFSFPVSGRPVRRHDRGPRGETRFTGKKVKPAASYIPRIVAPRKRGPRRFVRQSAK